MKNRLFIPLKKHGKSSFLEYTIADYHMRKNFFHMETYQETISLYPEIIGKENSHDFYTITFWENGKGKMKIGFQEYEITPYTMVFLSPGQLHQLKEIKGLEGFEISFSKDFLSNISHNVRNLIVNKIFPKWNNVSICQISKVGQDVIKNIIGKIENKYNTPANIEYQKDYLASLLSILLFDILEYGIWHTSTDNTDDVLAYDIFLDFMNCVESNFKQIHSAQGYIDVLYVSKNKLTKSVIKVTGKTPTELINGRIIIEAKRMLIERPNMHIKEIAYSLGFSDSSNFVKFFKKNAGISPTQFRQEI